MTDFAEKKRKLESDILEVQNALRLLQESYAQQDDKVKTVEITQLEQGKLRERIEKEKEEAEGKLSVNCTIVLKELALAQKGYDGKKAV